MADLLHSTGTGIDGQGIADQQDGDEQPVLGLQFRVLVHIDFAKRNARSVCLRGG